MSARLFFAGFSDPLGHELLETMEESDFPVADIELFDLPPSGQVTRFRGEARLVQPLPEEPGQIPDELSGADLAFLCGTAQEMSEMQCRCEEAGVPAVSLAPRGPNAPEGPCVFLTGQEEQPVRGEWPVLYIPAPPACVAARAVQALRPLGSLTGIEALCLVPASEAHREGAQALFDQSMALVNMESLPEEVHTGQRAFNLRPRGRDQRTEHELSELLELRAESILVTGVETPVFHGYGLSLTLRLDQAPDPIRATALLDEARLSVVEEELATPALAVSDEELRLAPPVIRGNTVLLWAVFEPHSSGSLGSALFFARRLLEGGPM